ncbi:serine/threonine kinase 16 [Saccharata proteae CBS 121410]|uniref:Serine/threonine kinase 16 n=1 Tax=Saccharata proteae CBS 121410 TaxID=1314787 RepID=A0A9P4LYA7_9PEZI|nr:serine/threonine kinase 16 [Saccharata proteae CBS 121410]
METNHADQDIHKIEDELHTEILPGTEVMADVGSIHFVKSSDKSHRVLVPQPSDSPHDPLNWSFAWKITTISVASYSTFCQGFGPLSLAPMFEYYTRDFNCTLAEAVQFTGVAILVLGFSNFLWVPISTSFGKRPVYLLSTTVCLGASIWRAKAQTYNSFMGASVLGGIGSGAGETIQPAVIADIFFLHSRGRWNTLVSPTISGSMALHVGWRNFWWLNVAMLGLSLILVLFLFPETKYHRQNPDEQPTPTPRPSNEKNDIGTIEKARSSSQESNQSNNPIAISHGPDPSTIPPTPHLGRGHPSRSQWRLYQTNTHPLHDIFLGLWVPWKLFAFPIIEFASFVVSFSCACFLAVNLTQTQAFAAPPYNFSSEVIGFTNFAILIGAFIGLSTAGPLSDWVSARATRANNGIREPEMRLPAMMPYVLIMILGSVCLGVGYEEHWSWAAIVVVGFACQGIQVAALPAIVTTYAVDSYKPVAGSLFVSVTVNKNLWGYGFSKFVTPWIDSDGFIAPIMTNCALTTLFCSFGVLFYYKGKTFRRWSKDSSVHRM